MFAIESPLNLRVKSFYASCNDISTEVCFKFLIIYLNRFSSHYNRSRRFEKIPETSIVLVLKFRDTEKE